MSERQAVTLGLFILAAGMLAMAVYQPSLWDVQLFGVVLQAIVISGIIGLVAGFHFAANKADETKAENTGAAFRAIEAVSNQASGKADDPVHIEAEPKE